MSQLTAQPMPCGNTAALSIYEAEQDIIQRSDDRDSDLESINDELIAEFKGDIQGCLIKQAEQYAKNQTTTAVEFLADWLHAALTLNANDEMNEHCTEWVRAELENEEREFYLSEEDKERAIEILPKDVMGLEKAA